MILHSIEMACVGPFSEPVRVGPFAKGLNVLAARNEAGKTTAVQAAARALFDRHTTKSRDLKLMQPAGTDLAPFVAVEFEAAANRYRIEKRFLQTPQSLLRLWQDGEWTPLAEADAADRRVRQLLGSTLPGHGATRPEHWGMLGFLWARQGESSEWPGFTEEGAGHVIRARLAQVEIDPAIERLRERLAEDARESFTNTGQCKKGGPLDRSVNELTRIEAALADLALARNEMDSARERYERASAEVIQLEKEQAEKALAAENLARQAVAAEKGTSNQQQRERELANAQVALELVASDSGRLAKLQAEAARVVEELEETEGYASDAEAKFEALRKGIGEDCEKRPALEERVTVLLRKQRRIQALLKLRNVAAEAAVLARQVRSAEASAASLRELREQRARIPSVTPEVLKQIELDETRIRTLAAQVEALGLDVELTPVESGQLEVLSGSTVETRELAAGETIRLQSPQSLELRLPDWGCIRIRSGATEAQDVARKWEEAKRRLKLLLDDSGIESPEAARAAVAARSHLDIEVEAATKVHSQHLGEYESIERLREALTESRQRTQSLEESLAPDAREREQSGTALEAADVQCCEALPAAESALRDLDGQLDALRAQEFRARSDLERRRGEIGEQRLRRRTLETQITELKSRYGQGIDDARTVAQTAFVQAEARFAAAQAELPPDFEKLPERNRRAAAALQQIANELQARRAERDSARGSLETLGAQGIFSRETELEERKAEVEARRQAARDRGWSARIVCDLIEFRRNAATRAILAPLERRLTGAFAELTGNASRRVFLDENLQIAGIGRTREAQYPFDSLSQGAREQLLLCLRLSVASELASEEPQALILDDVLVNTDPVRQERILDKLNSASDALQILILTCHPDRYRGIGTAIGFVRE